MRRLLTFVSVVLVLAISVGAVWLRARVGELDRRVVRTFTDGPWERPARVYSAPFTLHPGVHLESVGFFDRLDRLRYRPVLAPPTRRGDYRRGDSAIDIFLRGFSYPRDRAPQKKVSISVERGVVTAIADSDSGEEIFALDLEPELLSSIDRLHRQQRRVLTLAVVPPRLIHAILATEDRRFYDHHGIDVRSIGRAVVANVTGGRTQGGSTITQQLAKNLFLTHERTLRRKLRELVFALVLEYRYSKNQILQAYLNEIYLGQDGSRAIHGIWEASQFYFARAPAELSLGESALLAGMIRAPNATSPQRHPKRARRRRDTVLRQLAVLETITARELAAALSEPIQSPADTVPAYPAPYFVDYVRRRASLHYPDYALAHDGLELFTTLDSEIQRAADLAVDNGLDQLRRRFPEIGDPQVALVALHPQTGAIVAMVGGRSYPRSQFNRAVDGRRQPGSVFKPMVFLAALEGSRSSGKPFTAASRLLDAPFEWSYDGRVWGPKNYRDTYLGPVTARRALELSLNTATARLARTVGIDRIRETARAAGVDRPLPSLPSLSLGAVDLSPLEVAEMYSSIANGGLHIEPRALRRIVAADGAPIEARPPEIGRAFTPESAYLMTQMLRGVIESGTGRGVRERGFTLAAAGKTGTTNDGRDTWFAGFTPDLVAVVWVGRDRGRPLGLTGAQAALPIWTDFMRRATAGRPERDFRRPNGLVAVDIDPTTGQLATGHCPEFMTEVFLAGQQPVISCESHDPWL